MNCVATFCKENELNADIFKDQTDSVIAIDTKVIFSVLSVWLCVVIGRLSEVFRWCLAVITHIQRGDIQLNM